MGFTVGVGEFGSVKKDRLRDRICLKACLNTVDFAVISNWSAYINGRCHTAKTLVGVVSQTLFFVGRNSRADIVANGVGILSGFAL